MVTNRRIGFRGLPRISHSRFQIREFRSPPAGMRPARAREARCCTTRPRAYRSHTKTKRAEQRSALPVRRNRAAHDLKGGQPGECIRTEQGSVLQCRAEAVRLNRPGRYSNFNVPTRNNRQARCRQPQKAQSNMNCEGTRNIEVGTRNIKLTTLDKGRQRLILARRKRDK